MLRTVAAAFTAFALTAPAIAAAPGGTVTGTIEGQEVELSIVAAQSDFDGNPVGSEERDWTGPDNVGGIPVFSTDDMETVMDCDVNSLVRLTGTGIGTSQEGGQFEFTIRLFAILDGSLVGGNSWTIDGMTMRQRLVFAETGG